MTQLKKPMNAYFLYKEAIREVLAKKAPTPSSSDISKMAAENWKLEPEDVKQVYREMARAAFEQHKIVKKSIAKSSTTQPFQRVRRKAAAIAQTEIAKDQFEQKKIKPIRIEASNNGIRRKMISLQCQYKDFDTLVDAFVSEFHSNRRTSLQTRPSKFNLYGFHMNSENASNTEDCNFEQYLTGPFN
ncbi:hypothetical protein HDV06_005723 [Boothiomyces sp. JEL0866]|nr:hypothetical protein HDV06_005723 [Boothiomyces sp. JEL0866]